MIDSIEWAAGLFEGEGCITIVTSKSKSGREYTQVTVKIVMTDKDVIDRFAVVMGVGNLWQPKPQEEYHLPQYLWRASSKKDCVDVLTRMMPFLGHRRKARAEEALKFCQYLSKHHGSSHKSAKLTEEDVVSIKQRLAFGDKQKSIAKDFNVSPVSIHQIASGKTWKHVTVFA